ncbi:hypothetical protein BASA50_005281 [Batrachochytrium salamandrivorans]|uniref:RRM domain-containing protein n=1 Tax=Batrachochytrium salamandrivorans TaxID=1357716 RepID=A0ABQ8FD82_9FUNG|nr:hypothetical protein BASA60_009649 [Batrachochytrium salamandrivorans]KAH6577902.1 hypothetical protein BASA62_000610 [Batrachochytrium salamandrivorans]KAH6589832.1 hypothetical protein BASA61_005475 [Batrachochytrium salamandrivorans]KAH6596240.1 hypothetical protein BASA50_005281 [Batrachochytrium salamandrivorans]KAH9272114.1 hypothetical protein BASA83_005703 [Batrachochytrium salamandrivorans]
MSAKVYVGGLSWDTTDSSLRSRFEEFGEVVSAVVIMDRETGRSKGFGFVEYSDPKGANGAVEGLRDQELDGRTIRVDIANARPPRDGGGGGGFRGGDRPYGGGGGDRGGRREYGGGGERSAYRGGGERREYGGDRGGDRREYGGDRGGDRRDYGDRKSYNKPYDRPSGDRAAGERPSGDRAAGERKNYDN